MNLYAYEAGLSQNLQSPANIRPDVISEKLSDLSPEDLQIPDELGTVKAAHFVEGSKTVFHIQDLHINEAAQIQVARLLDYLNRNLKTNQVFIEGAAGEIAHALISKHPDKKALKLVARALLRQGKITGPEYYALVRNSEIVLSGIESDAGYEKNRLAYLKAQKLGERVQKQMKYLRRIVESLGVMIFDSAISEWLLRVDQFRNEKISVAEFGDYLLAQLERLKIDVNPFPELKHLKALREEENKLGKIVSPVSLNSVKLFAEIEKAQKIIEAAILNEGEKKRSAEEAHDFKEFVRLNQIVAAVESLITFSLNHEMATSMRVRAGEFAPRKLLEDLMRLAARHSVTMHTDQMNISLLEGALSAFQEFYQAALSRDDELLLNTMRTFEKNKIQRAVLVAGGFHTPYIEARLKRLGVSFVTITPRLEGRIDFKGDERIYRQSMEFGTSEESPNESLKDSQFQLQIPSRLPRVSDLENLNLGMSVSQAIRNNPRLEAGLEMILMTAVTSLRLRGKNPLQSVARFASSFPTSWKVFSRVYLKLYQPGVLQRQYKSGSGELVVPFEPELGFGLDARWNEGLGFAFNSLQSKSRGKSQVNLYTSDGLETSIQVLKDSQLVDLARKRIVRVQESIRNVPAPQRFIAKTNTVRPKPVTQKQKPEISKKPTSVASASTRLPQERRVWRSPEYSRRPLIDAALSGFWSSLGAAIKLSDDYVLDGVKPESASRSEVRCGYLDYVGPRDPNKDPFILPAEFVEGITRSTRILSGRGTQAYGFEVKAEDAAGNVVLLGLKDVNPKRAVLHERLRQDVEQELVQARNLGYKPLGDLADYASHLRFGTSSEPSRIETHPHPSEEEMVTFYDWSDPAKPIVALRKNYQISVKHNGDNDGIKTEEDILRDHPIFAFGKEMDYNDIRKQMNRILYKDHTKGDSPVIASMLALYTTQGRWSASARLAYLMMAGSLEESFAGLSEPSQVTKLVRVWGQAFDDVFKQHKEKIFKKENGAWQVDSGYVRGTFLGVLQTAINSDRRISQHPYFKNLSPADLNAFTQTALYLFLYQDTYRAIQMMLATSLASSTFGLSVNSTLQPRKKFWVAKGQPGAIGYNPKTGAFIAGSDPGAVFGGLNQDSKFLPLNDDQGELVELDMKRPRSPKMKMYSFSKHRELSDDELSARWIPVKNNPYVTLPAVGDSAVSNLKRDLADLSGILLEINKSFDPALREKAHLPSNRVSADRFIAEFVEIAKKHRQWREAKLEAWVQAGKRVEDFREEKNQTADLLIIAEGPSYDVAAQKREDLEAIAQGLNVQIVQGNDYMAHKDAYYSGVGAPFRIGRETIVLSVSQSGMTFSNVESIRDAEIMKKNGYLREVFILTGEWFTVLGRSIGQEYFPDSEFSGRIFSNMSGRRLSESATTASATDFLFTKLILDLFESLSREVPEGSQDYTPLNSKLSLPAIERLQSQIAPLLETQIPQITGSLNQPVSVGEKSIHEQLLIQGRDIANHVSEQFFTVTAVRLYTFFSVLFSLPIGKVLALIFTFGVMIFSEAPSITEAFQAMPMLEKVMFFGVWFVAHIADTVIYTFQDLFFTYLIRWMQGRAILDRVGPRGMAIGSQYWQLLRDYFRSALLEAPALLQLSHVDGRRVEGDFMHRFKDAPRGTIVLFQFDDTPDSTTSVTATAGAGRMSVNQTAGVRNWGAGPHILIQSLSKLAAKRYKYPPVVIDAESPAPVGAGLERDEVFKTYYSKWFNQLKLLVSGQVVAAEMAESLSKLQIPFYVRQSSSWISWVTDKIANNIARLYSRISLAAYSLMMQVLYRTPQMDRIFAPGKGQSGLTVFTTQLVAPRPNKMSVVERDIREIAGQLKQSGLDEQVRWIPELGVMPYVLANLYDNAGQRMQSTQQALARIREMSSVNPDSLPEQVSAKFDFGTFDSPSANPRFETRSISSRRNLGFEKLGERLPFDASIDSDLFGSANDAVMTEWVDVAQMQSQRAVVQISADEEIVTLDSTTGLVTQILVRFKESDSATSIAIYDIQYDLSPQGKVIPVSFRLKIIEDGQTLDFGKGKFVLDEHEEVLFGEVETDARTIRIYFQKNLVTGAQGLGVATRIEIEKRDVNVTTVIKIPENVLTYESDDSQEGESAHFADLSLPSPVDDGGSSSGIELDSGGGSGGSVPDRQEEEEKDPEGRPRLGIAVDAALALYPGGNLTTEDQVLRFASLGAESGLEDILDPVYYDESRESAESLPDFFTIELSDLNFGPGADWKVLDYFSFGSIGAYIAYHLSQKFKNIWKQGFVLAGVVAGIFLVQTFIPFNWFGVLAGGVVFASVLSTYSLNSNSSENNGAVSLELFNRERLKLRFSESANVRIKVPQHDEPVLEIEFILRDGKFFTPDGKVSAQLDESKKNIVITVLDSNVYSFEVMKASAIQKHTRFIMPVRDEALRGQLSSQHVEFGDSLGQKIQQAFLNGRWLSLAGYLVAGVILYFAVVAIIDLPIEAIGFDLKDAVRLGIDFWGKFQYAIYWVGIGVGTLLTLIVFRSPGKKTHSLSLKNLAAQFIYRTVFIVGAVAVGLGILSIVPVQFAVAALVFAYGTLLAGYLFPVVFQWGLVVGSIPFSWIPGIQKKSASKSKLAALLGLGVVVATSYLTVRGISEYRTMKNSSRAQSIGLYDQQLPQESGPHPVVKALSDSRSLTPVVVESSFEFENLQPLLYLDDRSQISVPLAAQKDGYLSLDPESGISTEDYLQSGKVLPVVGGTPLLKVQLPVLQERSESDQKMIDYLDHVEKRQRPLVQKGAMSHRDQLVNQAAPLLRDVANYDREQSVDVYSRVRIPLPEGEPGFLLASQRSLGSTKAQQPLAFVQSERRLTVKLSIPMSTLRHHDLTALRVRVRGEKGLVESRILDLMVEPRLDGSVLLTAGLAADEKIFDWDFVNNRPKPVSLNLEFARDRSRQVFSDRIPGSRKYSFYGAFGDRTRVPIYATSSIGRVDFLSPESSWVFPNQVIAQINPKDLERLVTLEKKTAAHSEQVRSFLIYLKGLAEKGYVSKFPWEAEKFGDDFIQIRELRAKFKELKFKSPQAGILSGSFNAQGQARTGEQIAEVITPQIYLRQRITKNIPVEVGQIVIIRRASTGQETLGVIRELNQEVGNQQRGDNQRDYQEVSVEVISQPDFWPGEQEYGIEVLYTPDEISQEWLRKIFQQRELEFNRGLLTGSKLLPVFLMRYVYPTSERDQALMVSMLENPSEFESFKKPVFEGLPSAVALEQEGLSSLESTGGLPRDVKRILTENDGAQRRNWLALYLQRSNIPLRDLRYFILDGQSDVSQMTLDYLRDQRRILDLLAIHRDLYQKSPDLDMTKLARAHVLELIENNHEGFQRLVQLDAKHPGRGLAEEFFLSLLISDNVLNDPSFSLAARKIVEGDFWRTYADQFAVVKALEAGADDEFSGAQLKNAALILRTRIFAHMAAHIGYSLGEPQQNAKQIGPVERYDTAIWDRLRGLERANEDDLRFLEESSWKLVSENPVEYFKGRISKERFEKALHEYENLEHLFSKNQPAPIAHLFNFRPDTGSFYSDHVFGRLDPLAQRDGYLAGLNAHALERFLNISNRPENLAYQHLREQALDLLIHQESDLSARLLTRVIRQTDDPQMQQWLVKKDVPGILLQNFQSRLIAHRLEAAEISDFQLAFMTLASKYTLGEGSAGETQKLLLLRSVIESFSDMETSDLSLGNHPAFEQMRNAGLSGELIKKLAVESLSRRSMRWAIEQSAEWSRLTLKSEVFSPSESGLTDLKTALEINNFDPKRVSTVWNIGVNEHPRIFQRVSELYELRYQAITGRGERDKVGHFETVRLTLGFTLGVIGFFAGLVLRLLTSSGAKAYSFSENRRRSFWSAFNFMRLFSRVSNTKSPRANSPISPDENTESNPRPESRKSEGSLESALRAKESLRSEFRLASELPKHFNIIRELAREERLDYFRLLASVHQGIKKQITGYRPLNDGGELVLVYQPKEHSFDAVVQLLEFVHRNKGVKGVRILGAEKVTADELTALKNRLSQGNFASHKVQWKMAGGAQALESVLADIRAEDKNRLDSAIQILSPGILGSREQADYARFILGAAPLSRETVLILGGAKIAVGIKHHFTHSEALAIALEAARLIAHSA